MLREDLFQNNFMEANIEYFEPSILNVITKCNLTHLIKNKMIFNHYVSID